MWFQCDRGEAYIRETAPGIVILSWYPRRQADDGWPGSIIEASQDSQFPLAGWRDQDAEAVSAWLGQQPFWSQD